MPELQRLILPEWDWFWKELGLQWFAWMTLPEVVLTVAHVVLREHGAHVEDKAVRGARVVDQLGLWEQKLLMGATP